MIRFACPSCQGKLAAPEERAGAQTRCPYCKQVVQVPQPEVELPLAAEALPILPIEAFEPADRPDERPSGSDSPSRRALQWLFAIAHGTWLLYRRLPAKAQLGLAACVFLLIFAFQLNLLMRLPQGPADQSMPAATVPVQAALTEKSPTEMTAGGSAVDSPAGMMPRPFQRPQGVLRDQAKTSIVVSDKPMLVLDSDGHTSETRRAFFTPNGQQIISVSYDKTVRVWDRSSGETVQIFRPPIGEGELGSLTAAAISPDGKWLAVSGVVPTRVKVGGPLFIISMETGQIESVFVMGPLNVMDLAFSRDGQWLAAGMADRTIRLYDFPGRTLARVLEGEHRGPILAVAFSPDSRILASAADDRKVVTWNIADGKKTGELGPHPGPVRAVDWSPDGQTIATGCRDVVRLWSVDGQLRKTFAALRPERSEVFAVRFSPDGQRLQCCGSGASRGFVLVLDLASGSQREPAPPPNDTVYDCRFAADGRQALFVGSNGHAVTLWNSSDGSVVQRFGGRGDNLCHVSWGPDNQTIAWGQSNGQGTPKRLDRSFNFENLDFGTKPGAGFRAHLSAIGGYSYKLLSDYELLIRTPEAEIRFRSPAGPNDFIYDWTFLPDGRIVVATHLALLVVQTKGKQWSARTLVGHTGGVVAVAPYLRGRYLVSAGFDQTLRVWDPEQHDPLLSLFVAGPDWIAWTPEGYYAASPGGERLMGWHVNQGLLSLGTYYPAAQFRKSLYRPDVIRLLLRTGSLKEALAQADKDRRQATTALTVAEVLPPEAAIIAPAPGSTRVFESKLGVRAAAQRRQPSHHFHAAAGEWTALRRSQRNPGIQSAAHGRSPGRLDGRLASWQAHPGRAGHQRRQPRSLQPCGGGAPGGGQELPNLYVLAVGVSEYAGKLKLNYAAKDAERISQALRKQQGQTFKNVEIKLLQDHQASRQAIQEGLSWLNQKMTPQDVGMLFLSGHGMSDQAGQFYFLPIDVNQRNLTGSCLGGEQLKQSLANTPGRILLLLDACHSGAAGAVGTDASNGLADSLVRDLVTDDYGVIVVSSSLGDEVSLESSSTQAGFFTYALAEALNSSGDLNGDGYVYLTEMDQYTRRRVIELSGGDQHPIMVRPSNIRSFPIARR